MDDPVAKHRRKNPRERRRDEVYATLGEVTISSLTEIGRAEEEINVPLQRTYTNRKPVISASLADTLCTTIGVRGLLANLNITLGTSYTLDTPHLSSFLEDCIVNNYDFGTAYARLREVWYISDWSTIAKELRTREEVDIEKRQRGLDGDCIVWPYMSPRRVWDLYSNRVVPRWTYAGFPHPISHAWVDEKERTSVWTPINGCEWPVPIPKDTNLNLIRIEMLNLGVEYVWLDVLCLRQRGGIREDLRIEEWRLDVPTIGWVYQLTTVYGYLGGLGRPLSVKEGDLDSDRCWFNRAWTLQEVGHERKFCGDTPDGPLHAKPVKDGNYETEVLTRFHQQLQSLDGIVKESVTIFTVLTEMQHRVSTNPIDKIAGVAFLLGPDTLPAYYESESLEDAWTALVNMMHKETRGPLFFHYPGPGNAGTKWRPSWNQVMSKPLPRDNYSHAHVFRDTQGNDDRIYALCIEKGFVRGLAVGGAHEGDRHGELLVDDARGTPHVFNIIATHQYPILEDTYMLIGDSDHLLWVVGRRLSEESFEKVSVFQMADHEGDKLYELGVAEWHDTILF